MINFLIGLFVGFTIGMFLTALLSANGGDRHDES